MGIPFLAGLAGRAFAIAMVLLALVATPVAVIQSVRLDGISVLGWHLVDGVKQEDDRLRAENASLNRNAGAYRDGLMVCNASVGQVRAESEEATRLADASLKTVRENGRRLEDEAAAVLAARRPQSDACAAADQLILGSLK